MRSPLAIASFAFTHDDIQEAGLLTVLEHIRLITSAPAKLS